MLFDKPSGEITGRMKFHGTTLIGNRVSGYFARIIKQSLQIKVGDTWHSVNKIFVSRVEGDKND